MITATARWTEPKEGETRLYLGRECRVGATARNSAIVHYHDGTSGTAPLTELRPLAEARPSPDLTPPWARDWQPEPVVAEETPLVSGGTPQELGGAPPFVGIVPLETGSAPAAAAAPARRVRRSPERVTPCPVPGCPYQARNLGPHMVSVHGTTLKGATRAARLGTAASQVPAAPHSQVPDRAEKSPGPRVAVVGAGLRLSVDITLEPAELAGWAPDRIAALFRGIALVIEAKGDRRDAAL